jgi:hypothetical protein
MYNFVKGLTDTCVQQCSLLMYSEVFALKVDCPEQFPSGRPGKAATRCHQILGLS